VILRVGLLLIRLIVGCEGEVCMVLSLVRVRIFLSIPFQRSRVTKRVAGREIVVLSFLSVVSLGEILIWIVLCTFIVQIITWHHPEEHRNEASRIGCSNKKQTTLALFHRHG
jgi:hypothetical protein